MKIIKKYFEIEEERRKQRTFPYTKRQWFLRNLQIGTLANASLFMLPLVYHFLMKGITFPPLLVKINIGIIIALLLTSLLSYLVIRKVVNAEKEYCKEHDFVPFKNEK